MKKITKTLKMKEYTPVVYAKKSINPTLLSTLIKSKNTQKNLTKNKANLSILKEEGLEE